VCLSTVTDKIQQLMCHRMQKKCRQYQPNPLLTMTMAVISGLGFTLANVGPFCNMLMGAEPEQTYCTDLCAWKYCIFSNNSLQSVLRYGLLSFFCISVNLKCGKIGLKSWMQKCNFPTKTLCVLKMVKSQIVVTSKEIFSNRQKIFWLAKI